MPQDMSGRPAGYSGTGSRAKKGKGSFKDKVDQLRDEAKTGRRYESDVAAESGLAKGGPGRLDKPLPVEQADYAQDNPEYAKDSPDSLPTDVAPTYAKPSDFGSVLKNLPPINASIAAGPDAAPPANDSAISAPPAAPRASDIRAEANAEAQQQLGRERVIPNATGGRGFIASLIKTGVGFAQGLAESGGDYAEAAKRGREAYEHYKDNTEDTEPFDKVADDIFKRKAQDAGIDYQGKHQEYEDVQGAQRYEEEKQHRTEREKEEQRRFDINQQRQLIALAAAQEKNYLEIASRERIAQANLQARLAQAQQNLTNKAEIAQLQAKHNEINAQIEEQNKYEEQTLKQMYESDPRDADTFNGLNKRLLEIRAARSNLIAKLGQLVPQGVNVGMPGQRQMSTNMKAFFNSDPSYKEYADRIRNGEDPQSVIEEMRQAGKVQ